MSSSKGLTIFALIIGLGGLGLSGYTLLFALPTSTQQQSGVQNLWYRSYSQSTQVYNTDLVISNLSIIAIVNPSESLHALFTGGANIECDGVIEILTVYISVNGVEKASADIGGDYNHKVWSRITLPYSNVTITPGVYNISIIAFSTDSVNPNYLYDMALTVFTYK